MHQGIASRHLLCIAIQWISTCQGSSPQPYSAADLWQLLHRTVCSAVSLHHSQEGEVEDKVPCPAGIVGRIIGRGGETIRSLQQGSGAHILVDQNFPEGQDRMVVVKGRPDCVARARAMVEELIKGEPGSASQIISKVRGVPVQYSVLVHCCAVIGVQSATAMCQVRGHVTDSQATSDLARSSRFSRYSCKFATPCSCRISYAAEFPL